MKPVSFTALILFVLVAVLPVSSSANPMNTVTIDTRSGSHGWMVELASDDASRSKGLMFRKSMAPKSGMLFRFETTRAVAMWMKNTFIPLDMIFADNSGKVTHIHRGAVPHSLDVISSRVPARFVLEVNAGEADRHGITTGDRLRHPWILPVN